MAAADEYFHVEVANQRVQENDFHHRRRREAKPDVGDVVAADLNQLSLQGCETLFLPMRLCTKKLCGLRSSLKDGQPQSYAMSHYLAARVVSMVIS